ncbi:MAG: hypothetical protein Fur0018_24290 [Anaerolineales bacterium]
MHPFVSLIIPCYNEARTISLLLNALHAQTYPLECMEIIIADGMSTDSTREVIANFQRQHPNIHLRVVDNPRRHIPAALNCALQAASGEIIVRMDAHAVPAPDYVARCVDDLQAGRGVNVGGVWEIRPGAPGVMAQGIALAAAHRFGVGDAHYRHAEEARRVDTVPFGAFYRSLVERIGAFDETLLTNEDYEFNARIRQSGGAIWLNPDIRAVYYARPTLAALARQYARYGFWKWRMLQRYPETLRWRQALPPIFVLGLLVLAALSVWWPEARLLLGLQIGTYLALLALVGLQTARRQRSLCVGLFTSLAIAVMHLVWGSAFLWSMIKSIFAR